MVMEGGCDRGFEFCDCSCHKDTAEKVMHCIPCCIECPYCVRNLDPLFYDQHTVKCKADYFAKTTNPDDPAEKARAAARLRKTLGANAGEPPEPQTEDDFR